MKKKGIIISVIAVLVLALGITVYATKKPNLEVANTEATVEYGKAISTDPGDYLAKDTEKEILKNTEVTYKGDLEEGKDYDKVGEYTVTLKYKDNTEKVKVTVEDTVKPEFTAAPTMQTIEGTALDYSKYITATDLSGIKEITFDTEKEDFSKVGEYSVKATAVDNNGNKATIDIPVTVTAKQQAEGEVVTSVDSNGNVVTTFKATTTTTNSGSSGTTTTTYYNNGSSGNSSGGGSSGGYTQVTYEDTEGGVINGEGGQSTWQGGDWQEAPADWYQ